MLWKSERESTQNNAGKEKRHQRRPECNSSLINSMKIGTSSGICFSFGGGMTTLSRFFFFAEGMGTSCPGTDGRDLTRGDDPAIGELVEAS